MLKINCSSFSKHVAPVCLIVSTVAGGSFKSLLTRRCKTLCFTKLNSTRSPQSHPVHIHVSMVSFLQSLYCCCFISAYSFHNFLSLYGRWQKKISLQSASKRYPSLVSATAMKVTPKIPYFAQIETLQEQYFIDL